MAAVQSMRGLVRFFYRQTMRFVSDAGQAPLDRKPAEPLRLELNYPMRNACTVALSIWPLTGSLSTGWNQRSACAVCDPAIPSIAP